MKSLVEEGWTRRHFASGEKLRESVAEYESLGFEVATVPVEDAGDRSGCSECFKTPASGERIMVIFTRPA
jgi:hypothetical protein